MATGFNQLIQTMASQDFFTGVLPFVLSYVVIFLALKNYAPLFQEADDSYAAIVSVVASFFVARFLVVQTAYQDFFTQFFGYLVIGVVGLFGLVVILSFLGINFDKNNLFPNPILVGIAASMAGAAFIVSGGFGPSRIAGFQVSRITEAAYYLAESGLIWALVIGGVLWWTTGSSSSGDRDWRMIPHPWYGFGGHSSTGDGPSGTGGGGDSDDNDDSK